MIIDFKQDDLNTHWGDHVLWISQGFTTSWIIKSYEIDILIDLIDNKPIKNNECKEIKSKHNLFSIILLDEKEYLIELYISGKLKTLGNISFIIKKEKLNEFKLFLMAGKPLVKESEKRKR